MTTSFFTSIFCPLSPVRQSRLLDGFGLLLLAWLCHALLVSHAATTTKFWTEDIDEISTLVSLTPTNRPFNSSNANVTVNATNLLVFSPIIPLCQWSLSSGILTFVYQAEAWNVSLFSLQCPLPNSTLRSEASDWLLHLSLDNGSTSSLTSLAFTFTVPLVLALPVQVASATLGSRLTVRALQGNFFPYSGLLCSINGTTSSAVYISFTMLQCLCPPADSVNVFEAVDLFISLNNGFDFSMPVNFNYTPPLTPIVLTPDAVGLHTLTHVNISFSPRAFSVAFLASSTVYCKMGTLIAIVLEVDVFSCSVVCVSDASTASILYVQVSFDPQNFDTVGLPLVFYDVPDILSLIPAFANAAGGALIQVQLSNPSLAVMTICRFNNEFEAAPTNVSADRQYVTCLAPAFVQAKNMSILVPFDLSFNGVDWCLPIAFTFMPEATIDASWPSTFNGDVSQMLYVDGFNFLNSATLMCFINHGDYNQVQVSALWFSSSRVTCFIPLLSDTITGVAYLTVTNNVELTLPQLVTLTLNVTRTRLSYISPVRSLIEGGSFFYVFGSNFDTFTQCVIRGQLLLSSFINSTVINCTAPPAPAEMTVMLQVMDRQGNLTLNTVEKEFVNPVILASVLPIIVSEYGDAVLTILLSSAGSINVLPYVNCQFTISSYELFSPLLSYSSTQLQCATPDVSTLPLSLPISMTLMLASNDSTRLIGPASSNSFTLIVRSPSYVTSLSPTVGPINVNSRIVITGTNFVPTYSYTFFMNGNTSALLSMKYVDSTHLLQEIPSILYVVELGANPFMYITLSSVADQGLTIVSNGSLWYEVAAVRQLVSMTPTSGPIAGGTTVVIVMSDVLAYSNTWACYFDVQVVVASHTSANTLVCVSPPHVRGLVNVSVGINAFDWQYLSTFTYTAPITVFSASPLNGPVSSGTSITFQGVFDVAVNAVLQLDYVGQQKVPCVVSIGNEVANCTMPHTMLSVGTYVLSMSSNNQDWVVLPVAFTVQTDIVVNDIYPTHGPVSGNTVVRLWGSNFLLSHVHMTCRFHGQIVVEATVLNSTLLMCVTPSSAVTGMTTVEVSTNDQLYVLFSSFYTYDSDIQLSNVWPEGGPMDGGSAVVIVGNGFVNNLDLVCYFDQVMVSAVFINASVVSCMSPFSPLLQVAKLRVSNNAYDWGEYVLSFSYYQPPIISTVTPLHVLMNSSILLTLQGFGFNTNVSSVLCNLVVQNRSWTQVVTALNATLCMCPLSISSVSGVAFVFISLNAGVNWHQAYQSVHIVVPPAVTSAYPLIAFVDSFTRVSISGSSFFDHPGFVCTINATSIFPAIYINSSFAICNIVPLGSTFVGLASLSLSGDQGQTLFGSVSIQFLPGPILLSNSPIVVISTGGSSVVVSLSTMSNSLALRCVFPHQTSSVSASLLNSTAIVCTSPPLIPGFSQMMLLSDATLDFQISVLLNVLETTCLFSLSPSIVSTTGDSFVTLFGSSILETTVCIFELQSLVYSVAVSFLTSSSVSCRCPSFNDSSGNATVKVVQADGSFTNKLNLLYWPLPIVLSVYPEAVPANESILLTVMGTDFVSSTSTQCRFNSSEGVSVWTSAWFINTTAVFCSTPTSVDHVSFSFTQAVGLSLSWNGQDWSTPFSISYVSSIILIPNTFTYLAGAGDLLNLVGSGFSSVLNDNNVMVHCVYSYILTGTPFVAIGAASVINDTNVQCTQPYTAPEVEGPTTASVVLTNGVLQSSSSSVSLVWLPPSYTFFVFPSTTAIGQTITLIGSHYQPFSVCLFRDFENSRWRGGAADFFNSSTVTCKVPEGVPVCSGTLTNIFVGVLPATLQADASQQVANWQPLMVMPVPSLFSYCIDETEYSMQVTLTNVDFSFVSSAKFSCLMDGDLVISGIVVNASYAYCIFSAQSAAPQNVQVSNDGINWSNTLWLQILAHPSALMVLPNLISNSEAVSSLLLTVTGANFLKTSSLSCQINFTVTLATFVNETQVTCLLSTQCLDWLVYNADAAGRSELVNVAVSNDGNYYTESALLVTLSSSPVVDTASPSSFNPMYVSILTLTGRGFAAILQCVFSCSSGWRASVQATAFNSSYAFCPVHSLLLSECPSGWALVAIANSAIDHWNDLVSPFATIISFNNLTLEYMKPQLVPVGSITITVTGSHFLPLPTSTTCNLLDSTSSFLSIYPAMYLSPQSIACTIQPSFSDAYSLYISQQGLQASDMLELSVTLPLYVNSVVPSLVSLSGGENLLIQASAGLANILATNKTAFVLYCVFNDSFVQTAEILNVSFVLCQAPPIYQRESTLSALSLSTLDGIYTSNYLSITYASSPQVFSLSPEIATTLGGTILTLVGYGFQIFGDPKTCWFNSSVSTTALVMNDTFLVCTTPAFNPGLVSVFLVSTVSGGFGAGIVTFVPPAIVMSVQPTPVHLGTTLMVVGDDFVSNMGCICRFGGLDLYFSSMVTPFNSTLMFCVVPEQPILLLSSLVSFEVSNDAAATFSVPLFVKIIEAVATRVLDVIALTPTFGSTLGGTLLTVQGAGFANLTTLLCMFNNTISSPAIYINTTFLRCVTPASTIGSVFVTTANDGVNFYPNSQVLFTYALPPYLLSTSLLTVSAGSNIVHFHAMNLRSDTLCIFETPSPLSWPHSYDTFAVPSLQQAWTTSVRLSPEVPNAGWCALPPISQFTSVLCNMSNSSSAMVGVVINIGLLMHVTDKALQAVPLSYDSLANISVSLVGNAIVPVAAGGSESAWLVDVFGENFTPSSQLNCYLGPHVIPLAQFISPSYIQCQIPSNLPPPMFTANSNAAIGVALGSSAIVYSHSSVSFVTEPPSISTLVPSFATLGLQVAVIVVSGFTSFPALNEQFAPLCVFNLGIPVTATVVNSTSLSCFLNTNAFGAGAVQVQVATDGFTFSLPVPFNIILPATITSIQPLAVNLTGNTTVVLTGTGFTNTTMCRFSFEASDQQSASVIVLNAEYHTNTSVVCVTPAPPSNTSQRVILTVANDYVTFSELLDLTSKPIDYVGAASIAQFVPTFAAVGAGSQLVGLNGTGFAPSALYSFCGQRSCGNSSQVYSSPFVVYSSTAGACAVSCPSINSSSWYLGVSNDGGGSYNWSTDMFSCVAVPTITSFSPRIFDQSIFSSITIMGNNLAISTVSTSCEFGSVVVTPTEANSTSVVCSVPPISSYTSIYNNSQSLVVVVGDQVVSSPVTIYYQESPLMLLIQPSYGFVELPIVFTITGTGFVPTMTVLVNGSINMFILESPTVLKLSLSGPSQPSTSSLTAILNSQDPVATRIDINLFWVANPVVYTVNPLWLSQVSTKPLIITGRNFPLDVLLCTFGTNTSSNMIGNARAISSSYVECISPALAPGNYSISIMFASGHIFTLSSYFTLQVLPSALLDTTPLHIPLIPESIIQVRSLRYLDSRYILSCVYNDSSYSSPLVTVAIVANDQVTCNLPSWLTSNLTSIDIVDEMSITIWSSPASYFVNSFIAFISTYAAVTNQGSTVLIDGSFYSSQQLSCIWQGFLQHYKTAATMLNVSSSICTLPSWNHSELVQFTIFDTSSSLTQVLMWSSTFLFVTSPILTSLQPSSLSISSNISVDVTGSHFTEIANLYCVFGHWGSVIAIVYNDSFLSCIPPSFFVAANGPGPSYSSISAGMLSTSFFLSTRGTADVQSINSLSLSLVILPLILFYTMTSSLSFVPFTVILTVSYIATTLNFTCILDNSVRVSATLNESTISCSFLSAAAGLHNLSVVMMGQEDQALSVASPDGSTVTSLVIITLFDQMFAASYTPMWVSGFGNSSVSLELNKAVVANDSVHCRWAQWFVVSGFVMASGNVSCPVPSFSSLQLTNSTMYAIELEVAINDGCYVYVSSSIVLAPTPLAVASVVPSSLNTALANAFFPFYIQLLSNVTLPFNVLCMLTMTEGVLYSPALVIDRSTFLCDHPTPWSFSTISFADIRQAAPASLSLSLVGESLSTNTLSTSISVATTALYSIMPVPLLVSVTPVVVGLDGVEVLTFTVINVNVSTLSAAEIVCLFGYGSLSVPGQPFNFASILCQAPFMNDPVNTTVQLSFNGGYSFVPLSSNSTQDQVAFRFVNYPIIYSILPTFGIISGGTIITLRGSHFAPSLSCIFGLNFDAVHAVVSNSTLATCISVPATSAGKVSLQVSNNFSSYQTDTAALDGTAWKWYEYVEMVTPLSLLPVSGPSFANTEVYITVNSTISLMSTDSLMCRFGSVSAITAARVISSRKLVCTAPPQPLGIVMVYVAMNDEDYVSGQGVVFEYTSDPSLLITSVVPHVVTYIQQQQITVLGLGFSSVFTISCVFSPYTALQTPATVLNDTNLTCSTPNSIMPWSTLNLSLTGTVAGSATPILSSSSAAISVLGPYLIDVTPGLAIYNSSTELIVSGQGFATLPPPVFCSVFSFQSDAVVLNDSTLSCAAPEISNDSSHMAVMELQVVYAGTFGTLSLPLSYSALPSVVSISPSLGYSTTVFVEGNNFFPTSHFTCRFGSTLVSAVYSTQQEAFCTAPRQSPGIVSFSISTNGQQWSNDSILYQYLFDIAITEISPSLVPVSGGTVVTIYGTNFVNSSDLACAFGTTSVTAAAAYINGSCLTCVTPPQPLPGLVMVSVTPNGANFTDPNEIGLLFVLPSTVLSLSPSHTYVNLAVLVTVSGSNFYLTPALSCVFGLIHSSPVAVLSNSSLLCYVQPQALGAATVSVTPNNYTVPTMQFQFLPAPFLSSCDPCQVSQNNMERGWPIAIETVLLTPDVAVDLVCDFGTAGRSLITYLDWNLIICDAPVSLIPTTVNLFLALAEAPYTQISANALTFVFTPDLTFVSYSPVSAPLRTSTTITITGSNFISSPLLSCRFGFTFTTPATFISTQMVTCIIPMRYLFVWYFNEYDVPVEISNNGVGYVRALQWFDFLVFDECESSTVCSPYIPLLGLNGTITTCPPGSMCSGTNFATPCLPGTYQPFESQITCLSCPPGYFCPTYSTVWPILCPEGFVCPNFEMVNPYSCPCTAGYTCVLGTVQAASNVSVVIETGASALMEQTAQSNWRRLLSLSPLTSLNSSAFATQLAVIQSSGLVSNGELFNWILQAAESGEILSIASRCVAGTYCLPGSTVTNASFNLFWHLPLAPNNCFAGQLCLSPSISPLGSAACPRSYFCPNSTIAIPCLNGSYCPGGVAQPIPCPPSTFSNQTGLGECIQCPVGFTCPYLGMDDPIICPAGWVCQARGLISPQSFCPAGFWCEPGTPYAAVPHECQAPYFCVEGVASDFSIVGDFHTPQPCNAGFYCLNKSMSVFGTAICPSGAYCPPAKQSYTQAAIGKFVNYEGSPIDYSCVQGTFSATQGSITCSQCPAGFSCVNLGSTSATICPAGFYRSMNDSVLCEACPRGTFSEVVGLVDSSLCQPCLPGFVCGEEGLSGMNGATSCVGGYVCGVGTTQAIQYDSPCPPGFVCSSGTTPATQYEQLCPGGYTCSGGVSSLQSKLSGCRKGFYCPPSVYNADPRGYVLALQCVVPLPVTVVDDFVCGYGNVSVDLPYGPIYTRPIGQCPLGTTSPIEAVHLDDCTIDPAWNNYPNPVWEFSPVDLSLVPTPPTNINISSGCLPGYVCADTNSALDQLSSPYRSSSLPALHIHQMDYIIITFAWTNLSSLLEYGEDFVLLVYLETMPSPITPLSLPLALTSPSVTQDAQLQLGFLSLKNTVMTVDVGIQNGLRLSDAAEFVNTASITIQSPARAVMNTRNAFMVVYDFFGRSVEQPLNLPSMNLQTNIDGMDEGYLLESVTVDPAVQLIVTNIEVNSLDITNVMNDLGISDFGLPYFPYFSACRGFGSYMVLFRALENSEWCTLVDPEKVVAVGNFDFFSTPNSDNCNLQTTCLFEENMNEVTSFPRWFDKNADQQVAFYIAETPLESSLFTSLPIQGYVDLANYYAPSLGTGALVDVLINRDQNAPSGAFPRTVELDIQYQQLDTLSKQIITAAITLSDFDTDLSQLQYNFTMTFTPLAYFGLLNQFAFDYEIFEFIYLIIGVFTVLLIWILWLLHRIFTPLHFPPSFRLWSYFKITFPAPIAALCIWSVLPFILLWLLYQAFVLPPVPWFASYSGNIANDLGNPSFSQANVPFFANGRIGCAFLAFGIYSMWTGARMFVPAQRKHSNKLQSASNILFTEEMDEDSMTTRPENDGSLALYWTPKSWKRTNFILCSVITSLIMLCAVEFSFSPVFNTNQWPVIIAFKVAEIPINFILMQFLQEGLLLMPLAVVLDLMQFAITVGALNFAYFILGFFVQDVSLKYLERVWREELVLLLSYMYKTAWKRWQWLTKSQAESEAEAELKKEMKMDGHGEEEDLVAPVLNSHQTSHAVLGFMTEMYGDYSSKVVSLFISPALLFALYYFRNTTQMAIGWGIEQLDMFFYILFILTLMPFLFVVDILVLNIQELCHFWRVYDYLQFLSYRFQHRQEWWAMNGMGVNMDRALPYEWRSLDYLSYSSQYYLMLFVHSGGMLFLIVSAEIFIHNNYNPFNDFIGCGMFVVVWIACYLSEIVAVSFAHFSGIWSLEPIRSRLYLEQSRRKDNGIIPSWENDYAQQIEQLRKEQWMSAQNISTSTFKRRFVAVNREWIVQKVRQWIVPEDDAIGAPDWLESSAAKNGRAEFMHHVYRLIAQHDKQALEEIKQIAKEVATSYIPCYSSLPTRRRHRRKTGKSASSAEHSLPKSRRVMERADHSLYASLLARTYQLFIHEWPELCSVCGKSSADFLRCDKKLRVIIQDFITSRKPSISDVVDENEWKQYVHLQVHSDALCRLCASSAPSQIHLTGQLVSREQAVKEAGKVQHSDDSDRNANVSSDSELRKHEFSDDETEVLGGHLVQRRSDLIGLGLIDVSSDSEVENGAPLQDIAPIIQPHERTASPFSSTIVAYANSSSNVNDRLVIRPMHQLVAYTSTAFPSIKLPSIELEVSSDESLTGDERVTNISSSSGKNDSISSDSDISSDSEQSKSQRLLFAERSESVSQSMSSAHPRTIRTDLEIKSSDDPLTRIEGVYSNRPAHRLQNANSMVEFPQPLQYPSFPVQHVFSANSNVSEGDVKHSSESVLRYPPLPMSSGMHTIPSKAHSESEHNIFNISSDSEPDNDETQRNNDTIAQENSSLHRHVAPFISDDEDSKNDITSSDSEDDSQKNYAYHERFAQKK